MSNRRFSKRANFSQRSTAEVDEFFSAKRVRGSMSAPLAVPSWLTPKLELAIFRAWLYAAIAIDVVSSCLYLFVPAGTVAYFGGVATPSATFWCSTAATGDAVSALWCATALRNNTPAGYRDAARGMLLFAVIHLGAFARGHFMIEPHPGGGASYVLGILVGVAFGYWFGFHRTLVVPPSATEALSSLGEHPERSDGVVADSRAPPS